MQIDFRVTCGFQHHPKIKLLRESLGDAGVLGLLCLWGHIAEQGRNDGAIPNDPKFVAAAADYRGDPEQFVKTLVDCHLLDRKGRLLLIHNWVIRNPWAANGKFRSAQAREANRIRRDRQHREQMRHLSEPESGTDADRTRPDIRSDSPLSLPFVSYSKHVRKTCPIETRGR
jgi:hypothetical protein